MAGVDSPRLGAGLGAGAEERTLFHIFREDIPDEGAEVGVLFRKRFPRPLRKKNLYAVLLGGIVGGREDHRSGRPRRCLVDGGGGGGQHPRHEHVRPGAAQAPKGRFREPALAIPRIPGENDSPR